MIFDSVLDVQRGGFSEPLVFMLQMLLLMWVSMRLLWRVVIVVSFCVCVFLRRGLSLETLTRIIFFVANIHFIKSSLSVDLTVSIHLSVSKFKFSYISGKLF